MTCLSDLYYKIGWWFTVMMFFVAIVTLPFALNAWDSVFSFIMCGGIAFVGAAPNYKGSEHDLHYHAAIFSMVCSLIWVANVNAWWLGSFLVVLIATLADRRRWLLWLELDCLVSVYGSMIISSSN